MKALIDREGTFILSASRSTRGSLLPTLPSTVHSMAEFYKVRAFV